MKKLVKRWIAGVSAAVLLVSAVGSDTFTNVFMRTVSADSASSQKNAKSTGFKNLEQDTDEAGNYNTGYGLHTNKTASIAEGYDDGRTFDVNLESWYVGENPVDVATILDASGSMAWTVDTLDPLEITDEMIENINKKYNFKSDSPTIKDLRDWQNNAENDGYLPQDAVDMILDPAKTDNSKLSYADYMYYVYEERSSVSEFVPLGYWDGGIDPKNDSSLIGYYPFSGDLKNKAPKATDGASGMLINHAPSGGAYDTSKQASIRPEAVFSTDTYEKKTNVFVTDDKGLDIRQTAPTGGILLDSPSSDKFTIKMTFSEGHLVDNKNQDQYGNTNFLYITDGTNYYKFYRREKGSKNRMGIYESGINKQILNANNVFNASDDQEWTFEFDFGNNELNLTTSETDIEWDADKTKGITWKVNLSTALDTKNLKVILGYTDNPEEIENFSDVYIKSVEISDDTTMVAEYSFSVNTKSLQNSVNGKDATFVQQGNHTQSIETVYLDPVIKDNKYLDLNETSKLGAVMLDAVPDINSESGFTISMKLQKDGTLNKKAENGPVDKQNIFYLGDKNTGNNKYYQFFRSAINGGYLVLSKDQEDELDSDDAYYQGGLQTNKEWYINTLVFETDPDDSNKYKVIPYINGKAEYQSGGKTNFKIDKITVEKTDLVFLLAILPGQSTI